MVNRKGIMYGFWEDSEAVVEYEDQKENDKSQDSKLYASAYLPRAPGEYFDFS